MSQTGANDWVNCPICDEPDMRRTFTKGDEPEPLISCVNHACRSNVKDGHDPLVDRLRAELAEAQKQLEFNSKFTDTLTTLGFDSRLLESYRGYKMLVRGLEQERDALKVERDRLEANNASMKEVLMQGLPECELHQAMLEVMNHQNLEWTEEYAKLELERDDLRVERDSWIAKNTALRNEYTAMMHKWENAGVEIERLTERQRRLREALEKLRDCDWVISLPDRMDAVRKIAREALDEGE